MNLACLQGGEKFEGPGSEVKVILSAALAMVDNGDHERLGAVVDLDFIVAFVATSAFDGYDMVMLRGSAPTTSRVL